MVVTVTPDLAAITVKFSPRFDFNDWNFGRDK